MVVSCDELEQIIFSEDDKRSFLSFLSNLKIILPGHESLGQKLTEEVILSSIQKFSSLFEKTDESKDSLFNLYNLAEAEMLPEAMRERLRVVDKEIESSSDFFHFLSKQFDENYYSDFIASIINFQFSNNFNKRVLFRICKHCGIDIGRDVGGIAFREVPLRWFGDIENAAMRIDILVDLKDVGVLIIENKTKSREHSAQTVAYYEAAIKKFPKEKIYGLFLTPNGENASHPLFVSCNYNDFYRAMLDEFLKEPFLESEIQLIAPFFKELRNSFIQRHLEIIKKAIKYREVA